MSPELLASEVLQILDVRNSFEWQVFDAYLFDIDGTLLNSADGVHYNAFRRALREVFGIESKLDNVPVHGNTDIGILRAVVARAGRSAQFEAKLPSALEIIRHDAARHENQMRPQLCPAVADLLHRLQSQEKLLGVVSGNVATVGRAKIRAAGLEDLFSVFAFCDECETRPEIFRSGIQQARQQLEKSRRIFSPGAVCIVGDTPADIAAARANQVAIIAVATGIYSAAELVAYHPDLCLTSCAELLN